MSDIVYEIFVTLKKTRQHEAGVPPNGMPLGPQMEQTIDKSATRAPPKTRPQQKVKCIMGPPTRDVFMSHQ